MAKQSFFVIDSLSSLLSSTKSQNFMTNILTTELNNSSTLVACSESVLDRIVSTLRNLGVVNATGLTVQPVISRLASTCSYCYVNLSYNSLRNRAEYTITRTGLYSKSMGGYAELVAALDVRNAQLNPPNQAPVNAAKSADDAEFLLIRTDDIKERDLVRQLLVDEGFESNFSKGSSSWCSNIYVTSEGKIRLTEPYGFTSENSTTVINPLFNLRSLVSMAKNLRKPLPPVPQADGYKVTYDKESDTFTFVEKGCFAAPKLEVHCDVLDALEAVYSDFEESPDIKGFTLTNDVSLSVSEIEALTSYSLDAHR